MFGASDLCSQNRLTFRLLSPQLVPKSCNSCRRCPLATQRNLLHDMCLYKPVCFGVTVGGELWPSLSLSRDLGLATVGSTMLVWMCHLWSHPCFTHCIVHIWMVPWSGLPMRPTEAVASGGRLAGGHLLASMTRRLLLPLLLGHDRGCVEG